MFGQDSKSGVPRGQSSWGNDWRSYGNESSYGRSQSRDNQDDFRRQSFGRSLDQEDSDNSKIVCQNYLQNKCMRGNNCLFLHPPSSSGAGSRPPSSSNNKRQQNPWLNFCIDFQRGQCPFSDECRLLHVSSRDEGEYQSTGDIPTGVVEQAMSKAMVMDWAYIGNQPHCKEYLQGSCTSRGCNYRHLNTDQYVVEVLAALRGKFMMPREEMFQENNRGGGFSATKAVPDPYGAQQPPAQSSNVYGGGNGFEPDSKRQRGIDYGGDDKRQIRPDNKRPGFSQGNDAYPQAPPADEDFLDVLRRQNVQATKTNDEVKKTAQMLEDENTELRKALRLALDLNSHARSIEEFRNHLKDIQTTLRKRGYGCDNSYPDTNSWANVQRERPSSSQDHRMSGDGYSSGIMTHTGGYGKEVDRMDMQRSTSGRYTRW